MEMIVFQVTFRSRSNLMAGHRILSSSSRTTKYSLLVVMSANSMRSRSTRLSPASASFGPMCFSLPVTCCLFSSSTVTVMLAVEILSASP